MMLWKCCTQYASKFGKLCSGHRTGKGQFSFQSQRKAKPKNVQTTTQLQSSLTLALFFWAPESLQMVTAAMKLEDTPWKESYDQSRQHIQKQRHYFVNKGPSSQGYDFSSSHIWMWELDYKESWAPKNWCFWTVVLKKTLESLLDCKGDPTSQS